MMALHIGQTDNEINALSTGPFARPLGRSLAPHSWASVIFDVPFSHCSKRENVFHNHMSYLPQRRPALWFRTA